MAGAAISIEHDDTHVIDFLFRTPSMTNRNPETVTHYQPWAAQAPHDQQHTGDEPGNPYQGNTHDRRHREQPAKKWVLVANYPTDQYAGLQIQAKPIDEGVWPSVVQLVRIHSAPQSMATASHPVTRSSHLKSRNNRPANSTRIDSHGFADNTTMSATKPILAATFEMNRNQNTLPPNAQVTAIRAPVCARHRLI